jgi:hypothetical protein
MRSEGAAVDDSADATGPVLDPCYSIAPAVLRRYPTTVESLDTALARWWRWSRLGDPGEQCPLQIVPIVASSPIVAEWPDTCSAACSDDGIVRIRIDVDSTGEGADCSGHNRSLVDLLAHELGHAFGLDHPGHPSASREDNLCDGCAMGWHDRCESVVPSNGEISMANRCGGESPAGAFCPE